MNKIGFIVAMEKEYSPFLSRLGTFEKESLICGINFAVYSHGRGSTVLAKCGVGEIAAASATSLLIGHFGVDCIINFGLAGALSSCLAPRGMALVKDVVHYDMDLTAFGYLPGQHNDMLSPYISADLSLCSALKSADIPLVRLASGDKFVANSEFRDRLISTFKADICDMEGAAIALTCCRAKVPFAALKLISDSACEGATEEYAFNKNSGLEYCIDKVLSLLPIIKA